MTGGGESRGGGAEEEEEDTKEEETRRRRRGGKKRGWCSSEVKLSAAESVKVHTVTKNSFTHVAARKRGRRRRRALAGDLEPEPQHLMIPPRKLEYI